MYCRKCGKEILDDSIYCSYCGMRVEKSDISSDKPIIRKKSRVGQILEAIFVVSVVLMLHSTWNWLISDDEKVIEDSVPISSSVVSTVPYLETEEEIVSEEVREEVHEEVIQETQVVVEPSETNLRDYYTTIKGDGSDTVTLMLYLLGSDLESDGGYASGDLNEILAADLGDNLNVIVMTGGTKKWQNREISSKTCQYWQVKDGNLESIHDNLGNLNMTSEETLTNFITDTVASFPADRYGIILWDHGGGTFSGFGYDENYPDDELTLEHLNYAFTNADVKFDFVGFDACLMATIETAVMLEPHADYMIASEEIEESTGWYYTDFLNAWGSNSSMATTDLGKIVIDTFVEKTIEETRRAEATLSMVDLREIPKTYELLSDYFAAADISTEQSTYTDITYALSQTKKYGEGDYEQIDAVDFIIRSDLEGAQAVIDAIGDAVVYCVNSSNVSDSYGLAMYFPYDYPEYYTEISTMLHTIGYSKEYTDFLGQFVSALSGSQSHHGTGGGGLQLPGFSNQGGSGSSQQSQQPQQHGGNSQSMPSGGGGHGGSLAQVSRDYSGETWYDEDIASTYADRYDAAAYGDLEIVLKGEEYVLQLTEKQWDEIVTIELQVLLDDGEGYVDLGSDNVYEFDEDGDLIVAFDYTWVTLDGHTVPFYAVEEVYKHDDDWYTYGIVPAMLNETDYIEIVVYWDSDNPEGYVTGYRKYTSSGQPMGKGTFDFEKGDKIEWIFDYYTYDGDYEDSYIMGETYYVTGREIEVSYEDVGTQDALAYFRLTDIYNNVYDSEGVLYSDE